MSKNGLFRTLNGSCALSMRPLFIFSCRGNIISFSIHASRTLKSQSPTGCPCQVTKISIKVKQTPNYLNHLSFPNTIFIILQIHRSIVKLLIFYQMCGFQAFFSGCKRLNQIKVHRKLETCNIHSSIHELNI